MVMEQFIDVSGVSEKRKDGVVCRRRWVRKRDGDGGPSEGGNSLLEEAGD